MPDGTMSDVDTQLDAMPDIGLDWPDLGQADTVVPLPADPADVQTAAPDMPVPIVAPDAEPEEAVAAFAEIGDERRYTVTLDGIDAISDAQFKLRFDELSVLRQGENKAANLAQINRRIRARAKTVEQPCHASGNQA